MVFGWELLVADQPVGPEIGHPDLEIVRAGVHGCRDIDAVGFLPQDAEVFAVDADLREDFDAAEIESDAHGRFDLDGVRVSGRAAVFLKADAPRTGDRTHPPTFRRGRIW